MSADQSSPAASAPADQPRSTPSLPAEASPTRLFATLSGAVLVVGGTVGFFHASEFGTPGEIEDALGFAVNGWINTLHIVVGAIGLFAAGYAARVYSLGVAFLFGALAIWGIAAGSDDALLDRFPADEAQNLLHALLAGLGLAAFWAERPKRERKPPESAEERRKREERKRAEKRKRDEQRKRKAEEKRKRSEQKRDEKQRREERKKRDEKRREDRSRSGVAQSEDAEEAEPARSAASDRSRQSESGDDPASRGDEPRTGRERPSQHRRRPPRPPA